MTPFIIIHGFWVEKPQVMGLSALKRHLAWTMTEGIHKDFGYVWNGRL